jgi:hypothetical protein
MSNLASEIEGSGDYCEIPDNFRNFTTSVELAFEEVTENIKAYNMSASSHCRGNFWKITFSLGVCYINFHT